MFLTLLTTVLVLSPPGSGTQLDPTPTIAVRIDSTRREVTLRAGPFTIPASQGGGGHAHHGAHDMPGSQTPFLQFRWPMTGWLYAFSVQVVDRQGTPLPRTLIHHVNMMNLERRALLYDAVERTMAAGSETGDVEIPRSVGFPMTAGTAMGLVAAWANDTGKDITGVELVVTYRWSPTNLNPRPLDVLPLYVDVNYRGAGQTDSYDLPTGRSAKQFEFTMPIDGRLLARGDTCTTTRWSFGSTRQSLAGTWCTSRRDSAPAAKFRRSPVTSSECGGMGSGCTPAAGTD